MSTQTQLRDYFSYVDEQQGAVDIRRIVEADERVVRTVAPAPRSRIPVLAWAAVAAALIAAILLPLLFFDDPIDTDVVTTVPDVTIPEIPETTIPGSPDAGSAEVRLLPSATDAGWEWVQVDIPLATQMNIHRIPDGTWVAYHSGWNCSTGEGADRQYFLAGTSATGCGGESFADPIERLWVSRDGRSWTETDVPFGDGVETWMFGGTDRLIVNSNEPGCGPESAVGGCWIEYDNGVWREPLELGKFDQVAQFAPEGPILRYLDTTLVVGWSPDTGDILEMKILEAPDGSWATLQWSGGYSILAGCSMEAPGPCAGAVVDGVGYQVGHIRGSYFLLDGVWHRIDWFDDDGIGLSRTANASNFESVGAVTGLPPIETFDFGTDMIVATFGNRVVLAGSEWTDGLKGPTHFYVSDNGLVWEPLDVPRVFGGFPQVETLQVIDGWFVIGADGATIASPDLDRWYRFDPPLGEEDRLSLSYVGARPGSVVAVTRESRGDPKSKWVALPPGS